VASSCSDDSDSRQWASCPRRGSRGPGARGPYQQADCGTVRTRDRFGFTDRVGPAACRRPSCGGAGAQHCARMGRRWSPPRDGGLSGARRACGSPFTPAISLILSLGGQWQPRSTTGSPIAPLPGIAISNICATARDAPQRDYRALDLRCAAGHRPTGHGVAYPGPRRVRILIPPSMAMRSAADSYGVQRTRAHWRMVRACGLRPPKHTRRGVGE
jgi:hypothetical protein